MVVSWQIWWYLLANLGVWTGIDDKEWGSTRTWEVLVKQGRYALFLEKYPLETNNTVACGINFENALIATFQSIAHVSCDTHYGAIVGTLGITSMTIWVATSNFMNAVLSGSFESKKNQQGFGVGKKITIQQLREKYTELGNLAYAINSVWFGVCLWFLLDLCVWMSIDLDRALKSTHYFDKVNYSCLLVSFAIASVLSAECSRKVSLGLVCLES